MEGSSYGKVKLGCGGGGWNRGVKKETFKPTEMGLSMGLDGPASRREHGSGRVR